MRHIISNITTSIMVFFFFNFNAQRKHISQCKAMKQELKTNFLLTLVLPLKL